ncbi:MAG: haloacid dehalogenase type II [Gammaproteobacteria bacterium]|nr:haloacid dehalogenase type II [Gammaproteobacteria bacterium]
MATTGFETTQACVFDAYGTLFDVHSAVGRYRNQLGEAADTVSALWRTKQLEYTWLRSLMGAHADFWQVTGEALDYALDSSGIGDDPLRDNLMQAYLELKAYPEVKGVLRQLRDAGMKAAILSNGSPRMLESAVQGAGIEDLLDASLSVEPVGIYKPDPRVYELAVKHLRVDAGNISFMSSNAWDAAGAAHYGFRVAWVNRFGQRPERLPAGPHAELSTLAELPGLLGYQ